MAAKYTESDRVRKLAEELTAFDGQKPEKWAGGTYGESMKDSMQKILNRDKFQYDLNGDALYQQYKDRYIQQGKQAMMDTMGQASALTGGYGNSYAQQAGQQAYQGYLQGLNDKVPELYQMAMERYNQEGTDLLNKYGLMSDQYAKEYSRYRDSVGDWRAQLDYLATLYNNERGFDYTGYRDRVADEQWQKNFDEALRQYNENLAEQKRQYNESLAEQKRQYNENLAEQKRQYNASLARRSSSGGSSGGDAPKKKAAEYGPGISTQRNVAGIKGSGWDYTKHTLEMLLRGGNVTGAANYMDTIVDELNEGQYKELEKMWKTYAKSY